MERRFEDVAINNAETVLIGHRKMPKGAVFYMPFADAKLGVIIKKKRRRRASFSRAGMPLKGVVYFICQRVGTFGGSHPVNEVWGWRQK